MMKNRSIIFIALFLFVSVSFGDSLFQGSDPVTSSLFSDRRARKVGDIITISIAEASSSSQNGKTSLKNSSKVEAQIASLFHSLAKAPVAGTTDAVFASLPYLGSKTGTHRGVLPQSDWESGSDFEGDGSLTSSNDLQGQITAMIIEVLPNGNFIVEGKRDISVDKQVRSIVVSGIIRPEDIGADNVVESRYMANAKIDFIGDGPISKYRKRSLLQRIWDLFRLY